MNLSRVVCAGLLLVQGLCSSAQPGAKHPPAEIKLPPNPAAVVVTLDYFLGNLEPPACQRRPPFLIVRADGTVTADSFVLKEGIKPPTAKLAREELQALLRYVVVDQQYFDFDVDKVTTAIGDKELQVISGTGTVIRIKTAGQEKEVKFPLLEYYAAQYPQLRQLQQLHQVEVRLNLLRAETLVGGKDELARGIKLANQELKKQFPKDAPTLTEKDITGADLHPDGRPYVHLHRAAKDGGVPYFNATLEWPAAFMPTARVDGELK